MKRSTTGTRNRKKHVIPLHTYMTETVSLDKENTHFKSTANSVQLECNAY
jgi:hypothetical protein